VSDLEFVLADPSSPAWRSPLGRALAHAPEWIRDVTALVDERVVAALGPAAGVAGIELEGVHVHRLLRRLTDLDLDGLPAIGAVAHIRALVVAEATDRYRLWFPQEYSDSMAEVVIDAAEGFA
jgi:sarcosine oxidase gamma subunit